MKIEIKAVEIKDKEILKKMLGDYEKEITGKDEEYKYLDSYWEKENRWPFFILIDDEIAGFGLVNEYLICLDKGKTISEFYIKKEYRRKNVGKEVAIKIFEKFKGKWEVREIRDNPKAREFWLKVIGDYTQGNFEEVEMNDEKWNGWVQTFEKNAL